MALVAATSATATDSSRQLGEPVLNGGYALHEGVEVEDALVMDLADKHDVVQLAAAGSREGCAELDEMPLPSC